MIDLASLDKSQLLTPESFKRASDDFERIIKNLAAREALVLAKGLDQKLELNYESPQLSEIEQNYKDLLIKLKFVAIPFLSRKQIKILIQKYLPPILESKIDLEERLGKELVSISNLLERDAFKHEILDILRVSSQKITASVENERNKEELKPATTIGNWISEFERGLDLEKVEKLKLKEEDKRKLRKLFAFYRFLKTSSTTPEGLEEEFIVRDEAGNFKIFRHGQLVKEVSGETPPELTSPEPKPPFVPKPPVSPPSPPPAPGRFKAAFYFAPEDEKEIDKHKERLAQIGEVSIERDSTSIFNKLVQKHNLTFAEEILKKRFLNVIDSRLKNVREPIDVKEILSRPQETGGLGYDQGLADRLTEEIEAEAVILESQRPPKPPEVRKPSPLREERVEKKKEVKTELRPLKPIAPPVVPPPRPLIPKVSPSPIPVKPRAEFRKPAIPQVRRPLEEPERPKIVDIKKPPRVLGPVDELRELRLSDFRDLGRDRQEAIQKIQEKIELLGEESFTQRAKGIKAWQNSEIYKFYLDIGRESMDSNQTIEEIINQRMAEGKPYLTQEEFSAISDLNRKLRF